MSSWIVDKAVIDVLVEAFFRYEVPTTETMTPDALGTLLWKANYKSVNYRYNERRRAPRYTHASDRMVGNAGTIRDLARDGLMVFLQLRCYNYQSCDHFEYYASTAYFIVSALEAAVLKSLRMDGKQAYAQINRTRDAYPWGIAY